MENTDQTQAPTEMEVLKSRAKLMGIVFSNNIGVEALKQKIADKMEGITNPADPTTAEVKPVALGDQIVEAALIEPVPTAVVQPINALELGAEIAMRNDTAPPMGADYKPQLDHDKNGVNGGVYTKPMTLRQQQLKEQLRLVRIRIQCLDPKKKDLPGEIITLANEVIGTVRKYVPYGEVTDDGYHVPFIIYNYLQERQFLNIRTGKDRRTGTPTVTSSWAKEFAIEVLEPLTQEELNRLAASQAAAGSIN